MTLLGGCGRLSFDVLGDDETSDAGTRRDAAPLGFCASLTPAPVFCTDFNDGAMAPWDLNDAERSTMAVQNKQIVIVTEPLAVTTQIVRASWKHDIGTFSAATVSFDVDTPISDINDPVLTEMIFGVGGGDEHYFDWVHKLDGPAYLEEIVVRPPAADQFFYYPASAALDPGPHRVAVSFDSSLPRIVVTVDGQQVVSAAPADNMAGLLHLNVGVPYFAGPSKTWEIHLDNIEVTSP